MRRTIGQDNNRRERRGSNPNRVMRDGARKVIKPASVLIILRIALWKAKRTWTQENTL